MSYNLVIVESPTKSKTIEKFLGKDFTVKASMGHLRDLPKSTFGVDVDNNFEPKYINIRGRGDTIKELKSLAKKADKVYLATDPDREGEAISWHLAHLLEIPEDSNCRIEFHEITKTAVTNAIKNARTIDMDMVDAQQARRILDRIVGYQLSPLLWRKIHKGLSAGRVQSVAVKIVYDRDKEIENFVPEEYWTLVAKLRENAKAPIFEAEVVKYKGKKLEMHNAEEAHAVEETLQKASYRVDEAVRKDRKRHAFPPLTTSSLQQEANRRLNFTSKKTMMLAQQLYEGVSLGTKGSIGLITYMRTDSVRLASEAIAQIRAHVENSYGSEYLPEKPNFYATKKSAQDAHEAIRPTDISRTPESLLRFLSKDQLKLYTLIWNRAVASQMADAVYDSTTLTIGAGDYQLRASGSVLKFPGWQKVLGASAEDEKEKSVPFINEGTSVLLHKLNNAVQHFTEPPAHFTEATLIKELEDKGIGRPSTYAPTIITILDRRYIAKEQKKLVITDLGKHVNEMLTNSFPNLIDIPFSAVMEERLDNIAAAKENWVKVLHDFYGPFHASILKADAELPREPMPDPKSDVLCDQCNDGTYLVIKEGRFGKFLACPNFPRCRNTKPIVEKLGVPCPKCGRDIIEKKSRTGKLFYGCEGYPDCDYTSWDKPLKTPCPECGAMQVQHKGFTRRLVTYCTNPECKRFGPKKTVAKSEGETASKQRATRKTAAAKTSKSKAAAKTTAKK